MGLALCCLSLVSHSRLSATRRPTAIIFMDEERQVEHFVEYIRCIADALISNQDEPVPRSVQLAAYFEDAVVCPSIDIQGVLD